MVLVVKNLPANAGDVRDVALIPGLGRSLEEERTTHSSILAWRVPWTEESDRLQSMGVAKSWTLLKQLSMHIHAWVGIFRQSRKYGDPESGKLSCICAFPGRVKLLGGLTKHLRSGVLGWVQGFD